LKEDLERWKNRPNFADNPEVITWINEVLPEAINRAIAAEKELSQLTDNYAMILLSAPGTATADDIVEYLEKTQTNVAALTEENTRLTAQGAA
jgi:hypothetical protein